MHMIISHRHGLIFDGGFFVTFRTIIPKPKKEFTLQNL